MKTKEKRKGKKGRNRVYDIIEREIEQGKRERGS